MAMKGMPLLDSPQLFGEKLILAEDALSSLSPSFLSSFLRSIKVKNSSFETNLQMRTYNPVKTALLTIEICQKLMKIHKTLTVQGKDLIEGLTSSLSIFFSILPLF